MSCLFFVSIVSCASKVLGFWKVRSFGVFVVVNRAIWFELSVDIVVRFCLSGILNVCCWWCV